MTNKPSQQQPAEGENYMNREPLPDDNVKTYDATILPTEEEYATLLSAYAEYIQLLTDELDEVVPYAAMHGWKTSRFDKGNELRDKIQELAAAKRYTRQGGEDWEALYISEHLNLLAAKGRIAELEKEITEWKWKLNDAKVINERLISDDHASGWLGLSDEDLGKTVRQYFETLNK